MTSTDGLVRALYRRILRESRRLQPDERIYYRRFARSVRLCVLLESPLVVERALLCGRQGFVGHSDETDPDRIREIVKRVEQDMDWILRKYTGDGVGAAAQQAPHRPYN